MVKKTKKPVAEPIKHQRVVGKDLLQAIEPMLMLALPHVEDQDYAKWLLSCLRQELETRPKVTAAVKSSPYSYGQAYWVDENAAAQVAERIVDRHAELINQYADYGQALAAGVEVINVPNPRAADDDLDDDF